MATTKVTKGVIADNAVGIDQLDVTDGSNGQVLSTNGSGTLSFTTVTSYTDSDVETYLDGGTSTPTFSTITSEGTVTINPSSGDAVLNIQNGADTQTLRIDQNSLRTTTNSDIHIFTNGNTNQLFLNQSTGNVGVGQASPNAKLDVKGSYGSPQALISSSDGDGLYIHAQGGPTHTNWCIGQQKNMSGLEFTPSTVAGGSTFSTPAMVIKTTGEVGIGESNPITPLHVKMGTGKNILFQDALSSAALKFTTDAGAGYAAGTINASNLAINGDSSGWVSINNSSRSSGAFEHLAVDGWITSFDGNTTALFGGSGTTGYVGTFSSHDFVIRTGNTDRTKITSSGTLEHSGNNGAFAFGASSGNVTRIRGNADGLHMHYGSEGNPRLSIGRDEYNSGQAGIVFMDPGYGKANGGVGIGSASRGNMAFATSDNTTFTERMRLTSDGTLCVNRTGIFGTGNTTSMIVTGKSASCAYWTAPNTAGYDIHTFFNGGLGVIGIIEQNSTLNGVSYNTSSDYRLKENVNYDWDATSIVKQLKPAEYNFISDPNNTYQQGFIAHELAEHLPFAVSGEKDAVIPAVLYQETDQEVIDGEALVGDIKEEEKIKPQQVDYSKVVALLVKTIQELEARIATLESA